MSRTDFFYTTTDEPHSSRRKAMLSKYGDQIKQLYGPDPRSKYIIIFLVTINLMTAYYLRNAEWWVMLIVGYFWGGTINHSLTLAVHELSHNLVFANPTHNILFGFFACLPHGVPTFVTFKKYHLIHHRAQGVNNIDPDLPTPFEGKFFTTIPRKIFFILFQPFFYSIRPMYLYPGDISMIELVQYAFQITFDLIIFKYWGVKPLIYLFGSLVLGSGAHPLAGHFVAEHYVWSDKKDRNGKEYETYSYYGPLNYLTFFVGYHNEHHDFPQIPGRRLYKLHQIAPEFYVEVKDTAHKSWVACMIRFVFDPTINPFSRVIRNKN